MTGLYILLCFKAQSELAILNRKMQQCMADLEKTEERRLTAQTKLMQATEMADDAKRFVPGAIVLSQSELY